MRTPSLSLALGLITLSLSAHAAPRRPDLAVTLTAPSNVVYGANARYEVTVRNVGNNRALAPIVEVQLPQTATSPTVHVLGDLGSRDSRCALSGTSLRCTLSNLGANRATTVWFELASPYSTAPMTLSATASVANETNLANNTATHTLSLTAAPLAVNAPRQTLVRHCTGTNLTSFYECELYPSSITEHETQLNANGTLDFLGAAAGIYFGTWSQPAPNRLEFTYTDNGAAVASFSGYSVDNCFEGRTTFPNSSYVSMYQVCLR